MDMKRIISILFFTLQVVVGGINIQGQTIDFDKNSLTKRFVSQLNLFPQEKVYVHTDKGSYLAGDTLWFRSYLVDATLHKPLENKYVYVDLVSPLDSVVAQALIRQDNGIYRGYLALSRDLADGDYTLRGYSRYMLKNSKECVYRRPIRIVTPIWNRMSVNAHSYNDEKKMEMHMTFSMGDKPLPIVEAEGATKTKSKIALKRLSDVKGGLLSEWGKDDWKGNMSWLLFLKDDANNVYRRYWPISTVNEDFDVTFYPEGGYLLNGLDCRIAFKAIGHTGNAVVVNLDIMDDSGEVVASAATQHEGMGVFSLTPEKGKEYTARCEDNFGRIKTFKLPSVISKAMYGLRVDTQRDRFIVSLLADKDTVPEPLYLVAHVRGVVIASERLKETGKKMIFDKSYFPAGVVQFLLMDQQGRSLSERLAFSDNYSSAACRLSIVGAPAQKREQLLVTAELMDEKGQSLKGNYSVSVFDSKFAQADSSYNILSHLLLTSELKGAIREPGFYFRKGNASARNALDLLMMTQGWRRYDLPEVFQGKYQKPFVEKHSEMAIQGRTVAAGSLFSNPSDEHLVSINGIGELKKFQRYTSTDKNGYFCFDSIAYVDGSGFNISAIQLKAKKTGKIEFFGLDYPQDLPLFAQTPLEDNVVGSVQKENMEMMTRLGNLHFLLQDVLVKAPMWGSRDYRVLSGRESVRYKDMRTLLKSQGLTISTLPEEPEEIQEQVDAAAEEVARDTSIIGSLESEAVGGKSSGNDLVEEMIYYGNQRILLFVDDNYCKPDMLINWITPGDVESISLVKDVDRSQANMLLCGTLKWSEKYFLNTKRDLCYAYCRIPYSQEKVTILNVTTKNDFDSRCLGWWSSYYDDIQQRNMRNTTFYPLGYQKPIEFYAPKYDTKEKKESEIPDLRTTLYWNPILATDEKGSATFSFYSSDQPGNYFLNIEGILDTGELVHVVKPLMQR